MSGEGMTVRLLGRPHVVVDGVEVPGPKGAKAWALLAYLARGGRPRSRAELAELLFAEAVDPQGALRWNLAALRRALGHPDALKGDPIRLDIADAVIDVVLVESGDPGPLRGQLGSGEPGSELLAGLAFGDSPVFELWLATERDRLARRCAALRREAALEALARGEHDAAVALATDLVAAAPLDEGHHALLIRTLALSGRPEAARTHYEHCAALLERELGIAPGPAVLAAVQLASGATATAEVPDGDATWGRVDVAWQSFLAGSVDYAVDLGRGAVRAAETVGDPLLMLAAGSYLAAMLSMAVRGWDEAATTIVRARRSAQELGLPDYEAEALAVLAGSELMRGDYRLAQRHASRGAGLTEEPGARALNLAFLAAVEADTGRDESAQLHATEAVDLAKRSGDPVRSTYAHAYAAHVELDAGRFERAHAHVQAALGACESVLVLRPWPLAMLAELHARAGDGAAAVATATRADGLAATTGIAYQRALAQRALALVDAAAGDVDSAVDRLTSALAYSRRTTAEGYAFHWPTAWVLHSLAELTATARPDQGTRWATTLRDHARATGMTRFEARAERLLVQDPG